MKFLIFVLVALKVLKSSFGECEIKENFTYPIEEARSRQTECALPTKKINVDCLVESCPELKDKALCLFNEDGSLKIDAIKKILDVISSCFRNKPKICDTEIDPIVVPAIWFSMEDISKPFPGIMECSFNTSNENLFSRLSEVAFTAKTIDPSSTNSIMLNTSFPNLMKSATMRCTTNLTLDNKLVHLKFPKVSYQLNFTINASQIVNFNESKPIIEFQTGNITAKFNVTKFDFQSNEKVTLPADFLFPYIDFIENLWEKSNFTNTLSDFTTTFAANAFAAVKRNCPKIA